MINWIIRKINGIIHRCIFFSYTITEKIYLKSIGIKCGEKTKFRGWTSFFYVTGSTISIGKKCRFNSSEYTNHIGLNHRCIICTYSPNAVIKIADETGMSSTTINCWDTISIGQRVRIGANCVIMDSDFHIDDSRVGSPKPIFIDDDVWLGANVVVMKGVHIGHNSVIGMNSVVTKDIPADCVAAGNPCKVIRFLNHD